MTEANSLGSFLLVRNLLRSLLYLNNQITEFNMSRFAEVKSLVDSLEGDMDKFYNKGNKTAGTRARKTLQDLKKNCTRNPR